MNKEATTGAAGAAATTGTAACAGAVPSSAAATDSAGAGSVGGCSTDGRASATGAGRAPSAAPATAAVRAAAAAAARSAGGGESGGKPAGTVGHLPPVQQQRTPWRSSAAGVGSAAVRVGNLPIHKHREKILDHINNNFITCIQGETGCGKSTQVPKFLLDQDAAIQRALQAIRSGKEPPPSSNSLPLPSLKDYRPLKCIVTQPRRLACISLAQRVARELGEDTGGVVGYRISGENRTSRRTKVFFMTTGYLLQILVNAQPALSHILTEEELSLEAAGKLALLERRQKQQQQQRGGEQSELMRTDRGEGDCSEGYLDSVTHVILDEVHERDVDADLLSLVLKLQLRSRVGRLKVVVMSATMEGNLFFNYFSDIHLKRVTSGVDDSKESADASCSSKFPDSFVAKDEKPALPADARQEQQEQKEQAPDESHYPEKIYVGAKRFPVQILYIDDLLHMKCEEKNLRPVSIEQLSGDALLIEGKEEPEMDSEQQTAIRQQQQQQKPQTGTTPAKPAAFSSSTATDDAEGEQTKEQHKQAEKLDIIGALLSRKGHSKSNIVSPYSLAYLSEADRNLRNDPRSNDGSVQPDIQRGLEFVCRDLVSTLAYGGETILVFLPGIAEISTLFETLAPLERGEGEAVKAGKDGEASGTGETPGAPGEGATEEGSRPEAPLFKLFVLHSTIGREEQAEVFSPPPPTVCHVVLASNIAESSLTLPNCRVVIDFCLRRQMIYDRKRHASALVKAWTSHASSQQRSGRTGRVFPGVCVRLVPLRFYQTSLRVFDLPEMQTAPLDKLYITVAHMTKRLNAIAREAHATPTPEGGSARLPDEPKTIQDCMRAGSLTPAQLLLLTVQPPPASALQYAQADLKSQGALDANGDITSLGYLMMQLPIDVRLCKLIFLGIAFGCPLDAVVLASCLASSDLFAFPALMLLQRHSKASAGYEAALQLQQQLKSRALFDGGHFSEPLMLRNCFVEFLLHFAGSTAELRSRLARQAAGSRPRRLELNMKMEYNRAAREFGRLHAILPKRLVQTTLLVCDLCHRVRRIVDPSSSAYKEFGFLLQLLQDGSVFPARQRQQPVAGKVRSAQQQQQQQQLQQSVLPAEQQGVAADDGSFDAAMFYEPAAAAAAVEQHFLSDALILKTLLAASFSPAFLVGKVKNCISGEDVLVGKVKNYISGEDSEEGSNGSDDSGGASVALYSWLVDRGVELSRCLFFNRGFSREKLEHIAQALSVVLPGVDFLLLLPDDIGGIYISASSAAAAEDASVQQMLKSRAPLDLYANCILYLPPTPRNECFHYNAETAAAAAEAYRQQLRSPPTAEFVSKLKNEREEFVRQGKRHWGAVEDEAEEGKEKREEEAMQVMGVLNVCNSPFECSSELKAVNEKISQEEPIRGKHFSPCTLFPSHPVCAQLINQYACGRWKFSLWAPGTNKVEAVPQKQEEEENANRETEEDKVGKGTAAAKVGTSAFEYLKYPRTMYQPVDLVRPVSPFAVSWYFMNPQEASATSSSSSNSKSSKATKVQGILSYRSPIGAMGVCPVAASASAAGKRVFQQASEVYAVAVAQQNKDSLSQAWAEGITVLPQRESLVLILAFLPGNCHVELTVKASPTQPLAVTNIVVFDSVNLLNSAGSTTITLGDLLRVNVLRHILSRVLQGDPAAAAAAAAALHHSAPTRGGFGGRRQQQEALIIVEEGFQELRAALDDLLTNCNQPIPPWQANEYLVKAGCAEDSRVQLLFEEGLPLRRNGRRGGGKKNADEAPSFTLPAFSVAEVQQGASLPLFDIPAIAKHFSGLLKESQQRESGRVNFGKQKGRSGQGGGGKQHGGGNMSHTRGRGYQQHKHQQKQRLQNRSGQNLRRGGGGYTSGRAAPGGGQHRQQHRQQQQQQQYGLQGNKQQQQQQRFSTNVASSTDPRRSGGATGSRGHMRTQQAAAMHFKPQQGGPPAPQLAGAYASNDAAGSQAVPPHQRTYRMNPFPMHAQDGQHNMGLQMFARQQQPHQHAAQHRYPVAGGGAAPAAAAAPSLLQQHPQQPYMSHYRQPQQVQQHYAPNPYGVQQPFLDSSRLPRQQQVHLGASPLQQLSQLQQLQQLQQLHISTGAPAQQTHVQTSAYRAAAPPAGLLQQQQQQHLGMPSVHGDATGHPNVFGRYGCR